MVSKRRIDKIGDSLKKGEPLNEETYQQLLDWRNGFLKTLDYYHQKLKAKLDQDEVISLSRRLKRIDSIQIKLKRFETMRLSTLQDIAGLRVVLRESEELSRFFATLRGLQTRHKLKRLDDYHNNPKEDGYRGMHLVYHAEDSGMVEIQLRTELEHIWATAVETYGTLQNTSFKTGGGDDKWKEFFALLSSYFAMKENCKPVAAHQKLSQKQIRSRLKKSMKSLKVIERLNASTNSVEVAVSKHNESGRKGKYALLELNLKKQQTNVELFTKKDANEAIQIYTQREMETRGDSSVNVVLVNIEDLKNIERSYPNYFLNTKKLLEILAKITLEEF